MKPPVCVYFPLGTNKMTLTSVSAADAVVDMHCSIDGSRYRSARVMKMNADDKWYLSKGAFAGLGASFVLIFAVIWWASIAGPEPVKLGTGYDAPLPLGATDNKISERHYHTPLVPRPSSIPGSGSRATVQVTPQVPATADNTSSNQVSESTPTTPKPPANAANAAQSQRRKQLNAQVRGMFPMGNVTSKSQPSQNGAGPGERFPSVDCQGRQWSPTGAFADSKSVSLAPTSCKIGNRTLYSLADAGKATALFLPSLKDPGKLAIYR